MATPMSTSFTERKPINIDMETVSTTPQNDEASASGPGPASPTSITTPPVFPMATVDNEPRGSSEIMESPPSSAGSSQIDYDPVKALKRTIILQKRRDRARSERQVRKNKDQVKEEQDQVKNERSRARKERSHAKCGIIENERDGAV